MSLSGPPHLAVTHDRENYQVVVIGAGAAGLLAAIRAAERGLRTLLIEKNRKPAVKILMSGGTRCNITQATDRRGIVEAYGPQGRFLHSALAALGPDDVVELFEQAGVATKVESTGKVFPVSDKSLDVQQALLRRLSQSGAQLVTESPVQRIERTDNGFRIVSEQHIWLADKVIVTTGGKSYPGCGTSGDGYHWSQTLGHTIRPLNPSLVPITSPATWVHELSGLTLPDVQLKVIDPTEPLLLKQCRNSLLLTHRGLSGPAALNVSRAVSAHYRPSQLIVECDLLPDWTSERLGEHLETAKHQNGKQSLLSCWSELVPRRIAETLLKLLEIPAERRCSEVGKAERSRLLSMTKAWKIPVSGTLGFEKAEVTAGGIALEEVDSKTMQSRLVPGLYFAGEILDLDGPIGGYNFQAAFSTGWLAGSSV